MDSSIKKAYVIAVLFLTIVTINTEGCLERLTKRLKYKKTISKEECIIVDEDCDDITNAQIARVDLIIIASDYPTDDYDVSNSSLRFTVQCIQGLRRDYISFIDDTLNSHPLMTQSIRSLIHNNLTVAEKARLKMVLENANDLDSRLAFAKLCNDKNPLLAAHRGLFSCVPIDSLVEIIFEYAAPDLDSIPPLQHTEQNAEESEDE